MEDSLRSVAEFPVYLSDTLTAGFCALILVFQKKEKKKRKKVNWLQEVIRNHSNEKLYEN